MAGAEQLLVLGAGYIGAKVAELALERGQEVTLADNWYATRREQLAGLEERGAAVETVDIRDRGQVEALLARPWSRVLLLAAQASRPLSFEDPAYTEETNVTGARHVAELHERAGRVRQLAPRLRARPGAGRRGAPVRRAGRPRAPVQDLRGAVPRDLRAKARVRARDPPARDRLRPEPGRARPPGVRDRRRQVPPAGRRRRAAARRRPGRDDRRRPRRGRRPDPARGAREPRSRTSPRRRSRSATSPPSRWARSRERRRALQPTRAPSSTGTALADYLARP